MSFGKGLVMDLQLTKNQNLSEPLWASKTVNQQLANNVSTHLFVLNRAMNTLFFADGDQLRFASLTCDGLYKICDNIPNHDPLRCAWCAGTDSTGYAYPVLAKNSSDDDCQTKQPLPIGDCPPQLGEVLVEISSKENIPGVFRLASIATRPKAGIRYSESVSRKSTTLNWISKHAVTRAES